MCFILSFNTSEAMLYINVFEVLETSDDKQSAKVWISVNIKVSGKDLRMYY